MTDVFNLAFFSTVITMLALFKISETRVQKNIYFSMCMMMLLFISSAGFFEAQKEQNKNIHKTIYMQ